ncbi:WhiB family transcriptional regulator [Fodinicola feengrottensis]|uniref:WhiB family transcriptional regulator n=1 Tax=Fodinicola feengrottensis TaxID=435914 RepID=UPI0013D14DFD|nr:WhiB family transcriptional regulator [Fodinicola feengrottensis]
MTATLTAREKSIQEVPDPRDSPRRACRDHPDPEIFDPISPAEYARAVEVCAGCPLADSCGQWAFRHREWGGCGAAGFSKPASRYPPNGD